MSNEIPIVTNWTSRIVGHERVRADSLLANPFNHRRHPQKQRQVVAASISELGFVKSILVNKTTCRIIDGHERAMQALACGDGTMVDVEYVELTEAEERKALLILDASSELATVDAEALQQLVDGMEMQDASLQELLDDIARDNELSLNESDGESQVALCSTWEIVVTCKSESEQQTVFDMLEKEGYKCRVLTF